jgi:hypothetical protein
MSDEQQQSIDNAIQVAGKRAAENGHSLGNWVFVQKTGYMAITAECTTCRLKMQIDVRERNAMISDLHNDSSAMYWKCPNRFNA